MNTGKIARWAQNWTDIIAQLKKAGITPSNDKLNPLANQNLQKFFKSSEGQEARAMNVIALNGIKGGRMPRPKAVEAEDIKLLSSDAADMVKKWTRWVDPKSGKTYTVINKKNNPDGTKTVRILNEAGELIKEQNIVPKKIVVIDNFDDKTIDIWHSSTESYYKSHGDIVELFLKRNNPVADVEQIKHDPYDLQNDINIFESILERIKNGEKIDVINCSFGEIIDMDEAILGCSKRLKSSFPAIKEHINCIQSSTDENYSGEKQFLNLIEQITSTGTRVVIAAGNNGKTGLNVYAGAKGVDVVGALGQDGRIADFTASRCLIQHLEQGYFEPKISGHEINITGQPGADIPFEHTTYNIFENRKLEECLASKNEIEAYRELEKKLFDNLISREDFHKEAQQKFAGKLKPSKHKGEYITFPGAYNKPIRAKINSNRYITQCVEMQTIEGTSFAAPARSAKIALNETMREILDNIIPNFPYPNCKCTK